MEGEGVTSGGWVLVLIVFFLWAALLKGAAKGHEAGMKYAGMDQLPGPAQTNGIVKLMFVGIVLVFFLALARGG